MLTSIYLSYPSLIEPRKNLKRIFVECLREEEEDISIAGMEFFYLYIQNLTKKEKLKVIKHIEKNITFFGG